MRDILLRLHFSLWMIKDAWRNRARHLRFTKRELEYLFEDIQYVWTFDLDEEDGYLTSDGSMLYTDGRFRMKRIMHNADAEWREDDADA